MQISTQYSKSVFDDAISAVEDKSHPCHHLVIWQKENGYIPFQLPEPFSGNHANLKIAFIGLNPSVTHGEIIPTLSEDWPFEKYDAFYRSRFDQEFRDFDEKIFVNYSNGRKHKVRLWNNIEIFGNQFLKELNNQSFRLGREALLIETVRYKTTSGWLGNSAHERRRVIEHQTKFTQSLIEQNIFTILVPMGNEALRQMSNIFKFQKQLPNTIGEAMGKSFVGETPTGSMAVVCPIKHMSYPPPLNVKTAVAKQIIQAYVKLNA